MFLEPFVQSFVHKCGQSGVLHPQFLVKLDGAGSLLAELVPHAGTEHLFDVFRGRRAGDLTPVVHKLVVQGSFPQVEQVHFDRVGSADSMVGLWERKQ